MGTATVSVLTHSYVPGWDCHGLPIEHKALAALGVGGNAAMPNVRNPILPSILSVYDRKQESSHFKLSTSKSLK